MGADFLVAWIPSCDITEKRSDVLRQVVADLTDSEFHDWSCGEHDTLADWKAALTAALNNLTSDCCGREVCKHVRIGEGYPVDITGGMSGGDSPTDAYRDFCLISDCSTLYAKLEEFALCDYEERGGVDRPPAVQALVEAAQLLLTDACDRGEAFPDRGDDDENCPRDEAGQAWFSDYFALREALKLFQPKVSAS